MSLASPPHDPATSWSARRIAEQVRGGLVSAVEVARGHLQAIAADTTNAVIHVDPARVLAEAHGIDEFLAAGRPGLALAGVPVLIKDNVDVAGQITSAGSRAHSGQPARRDAAVVQRLRDAGAIILGRANMDELAMGASTQTSVFGPTLNPHDRRRSPGGSSGGSAAAVAAGLAPLALGTDTGGSIREPAAQCGVVGLAPSAGLVPVEGVLPFDPALDRVGPLARSSDDVALIMPVLGGRSLPRRPLRRLALVGELCGDRNQPEVRAAFAAWLEAQAAAGIEVTEVSLPDAPAALAAYLALTSVAALSWLDPWLATGRAGAEVKRRYQLAQRMAADPTRHAEAEGVRRRLRAECAEALRQVDALVSPTMPTVAPLLCGPITVEELADPMAAPYTDCWTVVANLAGLPAVSIPAPPVPGGDPSPGPPPVGVMLIGRPGDDLTLLGAAEGSVGQARSSRPRDQAAQSSA